MTLKTHSILLASVLATPIGFFASPRQAMAQYRVDTGNANDANNRIGSSGANTPTNNTSATNLSTGNVVANGTVTGGRGFRGPSLSAPGQFLAPSVGGLSDRFIKQSSSVNSNNAQVVRPFYGSQYAAPPPAGFVQNPNAAGTYIEATPLTRSPYDLRLGDVTNSQTTMLPRSGDANSVGQLDNSNSQSLLTASPLYGIRQEDNSTLSDGTPSLNRLTNINRNNVPGAADQSVQDMRNELRKNAISDDPKDGTTKAPVDPNNLSDSAKIGAPFESPETTSFGTKPLTSSISGEAFGTKVESDQSLTNSLVPAPAAQMGQYAELSRRFDKLKGPAQTDQQVNAKFQSDLSKRQADQKAAEIAKQTGTPAVPGRTRPGGAPGYQPVPFPTNGGGGGSTPDVKSPPNTPNVAPPPTVDNTPPSVSPVPAPPTVDKGPAIDTNSPLVKPGQPLIVGSLTDGMKPSGLRDTLGTAEDQMRAGKFTSALDQYDLAERVAPNNPMITLGRAHAELGASYYARAESDIRRALAADGALMLGQYKLDKFLGRDRLNFLEKDLKDITTTEPKSTRAPFLLAYIKYQTGDSNMAANYLALSEKRAGTPDPLFKQLRSYWDLPAADPIPDTPDLNK